jgi:hypothetical protein
MKSKLSQSACSSKSAPKPRFSRCQFSYSDGRRCRMLRASDHSTLCVYHSREERQLLEAERIGQLLAASPSGGYLTATDVNPVLGKLYTAIAQNRIPPRNAATLAYVAQLLLHSINIAQSEIINARGSDFWRSLVRNTLNCPMPLPPPPNLALHPAPSPIPAAKEPTPQT